jgi:phage terminase small subunit
MKNESDTLSNRIFNVTLLLGKWNRNALVSICKVTLLHGEINMKKPKQKKPCRIKGQIDTDSQEQNKEQKPFRKASTEGFTAKQEAFIMAMSASPDGEAWGNASAAARLAGYKHKNAGIYACQLMKNPKIYAAIDAHRRKVMQKFGISEECIIQELSAIAFSNIKDFFDDSWNLKKIKDLPLNVSAALSCDYVQSAVNNSGIQTGSITRIKMHDKLRAIELLGKHLGMWTDKDEYVAGAQRESMDERAKRTKQRLLINLGAMDTDGKK